MSGHNLYLPVVPMPPEVPEKAFSVPPPSNSLSVTELVASSFSFLFSIHLKSLKIVF